MSLQTATIPNLVFPVNSLTRKEEKQQIDIGSPNLGYIWNLDFLTISTPKGFFKEKAKKPFVTFSYQVVVENVVIFSDKKLIEKIEEEEEVNYNFQENINFNTTPVVLNQSEFLSVIVTLNAVTVAATLETGITNVVLGYTNKRYGR